MAEKIPEIDIQGSAKMLIEQYGGYAATRASILADRLRDQGDMDGKRVWLRIIAAIEELQGAKPGETAH